MAEAALTTLTVVHRRRLREVWRSAGWPCQDGIEAELLAAGWLERVRDDRGRETLRVTDLGVQVLAATLQRNRAVRDEHEALVERVAGEMQRAGRVVWRGLSLRAPLAASIAGPGGQAVAATRWAIAMPDVYSIRHTTVEDYALPIVHEVKVRRADLLADLKRPDKGEAYRALCGECWYVLKAGIGEAADMPAAYGVMAALPRTDGMPGFGVLEVLRPAPRRAFKLPFSVWMALARAHPVAGDDDPPQASLSICR